MSLYCLAIVTVVVLFVPGLNSYPFAVCREDASLGGSWAACLPRYMQVKQVQNPCGAGGTKNPAAQDSNTKT